MKPGHSTPAVPMKEDRPNGLHQRYVIRKVVGRKKSPFGHYYTLKTKPVDPGSEYFVMRLDHGGSDPNHINACRKAIQVYANEIEPTIPDLAKDLRERYPVSSPAPGVAQHNSVKDMQDVFPGKQPEAISTNTAGVAATSDDAVNFDGSPVTVTDRIIPFNQILANRPEWDEKQRPVSGVAATSDNRYYENPDWDKLSKIKPPEDTKDNKAWRGAWLEGEMVGYAKCMVDKVIPAVSRVAATTGGSEAKHTWKVDYDRYFDRAGRKVAHIVHVTTADNYSPDKLIEVIARAPEMSRELAEANKKIENLKSVMVAAAEEIQEHWAAHCDGEGYGPSNLMHRLKKGLAAEYCGYKPGAFLELANELAAASGELADLKAENAELKAPHFQMAFKRVEELKAERDRLIEKAQEIVRVHNDMLKSDDEDDHFRFYALIKELAALADKGGLNQ